MKTNKLIIVAILLISVLVFLDSIVLKPAKNFPSRYRNGGRP